MNIVWSEFKSICDTRGLNIQKSNGESAYYLEAWDGPRYFRTSILISNPKSADQIDFETNYNSSSNGKVGAVQPFASKTIGKLKFFRRKHGYSFSLIDGIGSLTILVPYNACKINEIEIVNCSAMDILSLKIMDRDINPVSGYTGIMLNRFGFDVRTPPDFYKDTSEYDADVYKNMKILIEYQSEILTKNIGVNIVFHEVK